MSASTSRGPGVCSLLLVLFVALKLIGIEPVASWSWWWVTAPFWIPVSLAITVLLVCATLVGWGRLIEGFRK